MSATSENAALALQRRDCDGVAILTLNRPAKLNALSNDLLAAIMHALDEIELDPLIRTVLITGNGRAFSAGADIAGFQRHLEDGPAQAVRPFMRPGHQMTRRVESFPKPVIAAVNGLAFGGGCELVESTHIALAAILPPSARPRSVSGSSRRSAARSAFPAISAGKPRSS